MSYRLEKNGDLVFDGFEKGIANSPHKGIANIQNANISTESGEVMNSFARVQQTMTDTSANGSLAFVDTNHVSLSIASTNNLFKGNWITVTGSSNTTQLPNGTYYVPPSTGANFQLANYYNAMNFVPATAAISTLVVGGGAGGGNSSGNSAGGGGGAGGVKTGIAAIQTGVGYSVTIGAGGSANTNGSASVLSGGSISTVTADGGGAGGNGVSGSGANGAAGASGGGAGAQTNAAGGAGGAGTVGEGNNGGNATGSLTIQGGAGGGGAGAIGSDRTNSSGIGGGGAGGAGVSNSISGSAVFYGGGGGGNCNNAGGGGQGVGGNGGGGAGGQNTTGTAGTANTGGGGGGGNVGGGGGSGIVIISVPTGTLNVGATTGGTHTSSGGNDIWTFTASGTWTPVIASVTVPAVLTGFTAGLTASFTMVATMGKGIAQATETYYNNGIVYHRYYILDSNRLVWVYDDQNEITYSTSDNVNWFLPDFHAISTSATGLAILDGFLIAATDTGLHGKPTVILGGTNTTATTWTVFPDISAWQGSSQNVNIPHFCLAGHQGFLYVSDASYLVEVRPDSTLISGTTKDDVQTYASWTTDVADPSGKTVDFSIISGVVPIGSDRLRVPAIFFTVNGGVLPNAITAGTVYYIDSTPVQFNVYSASSGGSDLDMKTGASGPQYFNTFYPIASASASSGGTPLSVLTGQRLALPKFETIQCMAEIGNTIIIGCLGNVIYPWNQQEALPSSIITLPEANVTFILTVNQMGYLFAGNKGNIYITDGSTASAILTVPDYTAGVPGTPSSYIEPVFSWGGAAYIRGRVYFSIQDQTATKAGNCGGIWSFVPTQNFYIGQDVGISLRIENQSSYGTYNGYSPVLITKQTQNAIAPQYWSAWWSDITGTTYGIDFTGTGTASTSATVIETDIVPTGTFLDKKTYAQIEFKVSSPLPTGTMVSMKYRKDLTSAWTSCGTAVVQNANRLSGYFPANFEKTQWLQLQGTLTPATATPGTFIRMSEIRVR